jgi:hypothetical protein
LRPLGCLILVRLLQRGDMEGEEVIDAIGGLIALLVISYLIAADANKKGRSGMGWGLLCFFTCLIAVPIYFLLTTQNKGE